MNTKFLSLQILILFFLFFFLILTINSQAQNFWERTSGPGTVVVYDFVFKENFILIGTWIGGMYKSTDGGENWQHIDNEFSNSSVYALELLSNGNILAGTGGGIHVSSDNGATWFYSALADYSVTTITVDEAGSIYLGSVYENDIYKSTDNGISWDAINSEISFIRSIVTKEPSTILVTSGEGTYRSSDNGETWNQVISPLKQITDLTLNVDGKFSAISEFGDFYISTDDGLTWDSTSSINRSSRIIYSSSNGDLYLGSFGVYRSTNEGQTWNLLNGFESSGLVRSIAEFENWFYTGTYFSGVFRSWDFGKNWSQSSAGINNSTVSLLEKDDNGRIYAVSTPAGFSATSDNGDNWEILRTMSSFNSISVSPNGDLFGSHGSLFSGLIFRSNDSGQSWEIVYQNFSDTTVSQVNVNIDETVYAIIAHKLFKSTNNGNEWVYIQVASPDDFFHSVIFNNLGYIFIKSSMGYFRSSDNGGSWQQLTSNPEGLDIFGITVSDAMYAMASDSGYYSSTDYGDSWNYLYKGNGRAVKSFAENYVSYLFIVVQNAGILRSTDNGFNWQEINSGLENTSINCLIITDDDYLLAGTGRNGVYRSVNKTTSVENEFVEMQLHFSLEQNYPNPFNPSTMIRYQVPNNSKVDLKVYDVLGNEVAILVNEEKPAGEYEIEFQGSRLSSGIYFYQIKAGDFIETRKMILLK